MRHRIILPLLALGAALTVTACGNAAGSGDVHFAPYADVGVAGRALGSLVARSGAREPVLGFVDAAGGRCEASWGAGGSLSDPAVANLARTVHPVISFGGRGATELAEVCRTPQALAAQYQSVIDRYHAVRADFDLEDRALSDPASIRRRSDAIAAVQARARASGRSVSVSLTLPAAPSGLTPASIRIVRSALGAGVKVGLVNVLAMDYGHSDPLPAPGQLGRYAITTAVNAEHQLRSLLPGVPAARLWQTIGITAMIGRNDVAAETFTPSDALEVVRFAQAHHIGSLSFWSLSRDRPCPGGVSVQTAQSSCSGISQPPFRFTRLFAGFGG